MLLTYVITWFNIAFRKEISVVPILVGAINKEKEEAYGQLLASYLAREDTFFVVSSDFCHWYVALIL